MRKFFTEKVQHAKEDEIVTEITFPMQPQPIYELEKFSAHYRLQPIRHQSYNVLKILVNTPV